MTEASKMTRAGQFELCTDVVLLSTGKPSPTILLIRRKFDPYAGRWALPGGRLELDEDLMDGAARELAEETHIANVPLIQIGAFGKPGRDPRGRAITVAFLGKLPAARKGQAKAADDAAETQWYPIDALPPLAFDHADIIAAALKL
ncbi:NUDIX domain-containing protein [Candidimonas nitroreducens]|nr:NUDIX hydrolase [Candidimonas nitroreducens]